MTQLERLQEKHALIRQAKAQLSEVEWAATHRPQVNSHLVFQLNELRKTINHLMRVVNK